MLKLRFIAPFIGLPVTSFKPFELYGAFNVIVEAKGKLLAGTMVIVFLSAERVFVVEIAVEPDARVIELSVIVVSSSSPENVRVIEVFTNTFTAFPTAILPAIALTEEFVI